MKKRAVFAIVFAGLLALLASPRAASAADWRVSLSFFHQELEPYGRWVVVGDYGEVWQPAGVPGDWQPYVEGEWAYTDYGWTWVSDDPWGDIPYHYGTWVFDEHYGWVWIPGRVWAPAWVTWAYTDDYVGWAPVPYSFNIGFSGYAGPPVAVYRTRYVFVPARQFVGVRCATVRVPRVRNDAIFARARTATHFSVSSGIVSNTGLPVSRVERVVGRRIERTRIERVRTRPTAITAGTASRTKTVRIVAPAAERAVITKSERSRPAQQLDRRRPRIERQRPSRKPAVSKPIRQHESVPPRERRSVSRVEPEPQHVAPKKQRSAPKEIRERRLKPDAEPARVRQRPRPAPKPMRVRKPEPGSSQLREWKSDSSNRRRAARLETRQERSPAVRAVKRQVNKPAVRRPAAKQKPAARRAVEKEQRRGNRPPNGG
jgi:hypothetical protein